MHRTKTLICGLIGGVVLGVLGMIVVPLLMYLFAAPSFLVVRNAPVTADAAVVLGGGGPERLRKAIELYDAGFVKDLILVDVAEANWSWVIGRLGPAHVLKGKHFTIVTGSSTTETDAQLSLRQCQRQGFKRILAVTDPYHSRRVSITFGRVYAGSGIEVTTISSGDYGELLPPGGDWRSHRLTRDLVWIETGKTVGALFPRFLRKLFMRSDI